MDRMDDALQPAGAGPDETAELTLVEICRACAVEAGFIVELVSEGALAPSGPEPETWRFTYTHVRRVRVASHLQRDLGINPAGAALALELLEKIDVLRARLRALGEDQGGAGT
jgi:chaperone modulatory protein CbpM